MRGLGAGVVAWAALLTASGATGGLAASEPPDQRDVESAEFLFEGFWHSVEKIRTGVVTVSEVDEIPPAEAAEIRLFTAFDNKTGNLRFDFRSGDRRTNFARNQNESILCVSTKLDDRISSGLPRDYKVTVHDAKPIDFRFVALTLFPLYRNKLPAEGVRKYADELAGAKLIKLEETGSKIRLEYDWGKLDAGSPASAGRASLVFDRDQGLLPVVIEERFQRKDSGDKWIEESRTETTWKRISDTWVPETCKLAGIRNSRTIELKFNWAEVNEAIDTEIFELSGFDEKKVKP